MSNPTLDPATNQPLPADAIQRILHLSSPVHIYNIPPISSARGHLAATWTEDPARHIFTCRLRVIETSFTTPSTNPPTETLKITILLEDPSTGALFAAAPYTNRATVTPAADSSRFFALRVQDPTGRKATLGIGFEERSEAFDFGVALQEAERAISGLAGQEQGGKGKKKEEEEKRDYSLKEGETITVDLKGMKFGRGRREGGGERETGKEKEEGMEGRSLNSFALAPPPGPSGGNGGGFSLPPPPSSQEARRLKRLSAQEMGFDDGANGEFA